MSIQSCRGGSGVDEVWGRLRRPGGDTRAFIARHDDTLPFSHNLCQQRENTAGEYYSPNLVTLRGCSSISGKEESNCRQNAKEENQVKHYDWEKNDK